MGRATRLDEALLMLCLCCATASAGTGFWSSTGPFGGSIGALSGDPTDPDIVYALTQGGVYRSFDAGDTWQRASSGLGTVRFSRLGLRVDADDPSHLYVFDDVQRLYRSTNRGADWSLAGFTFADYVFDQHEPVRLVDLPGSSDGLLLLVRDGNGAFGAPLLRSLDGGASFAPFGIGLPADGVLLDLAFDPDTPGLAIAVWGPLVTTDSVDPVAYLPSIYRSTDGGESWAPVHTDAGSTTSRPAGFVGVVAFGPGPVVYASNDQGLVHRSDDNGLSWTETGPQQAEQLVVHSSDPDTVYWRSRFGQALIRTTIGGSATALSDNDDLSPNPSYQSTLDSSPVGVSASAFHVAPGFPDASARMWLGTQGAGLFRSDDAGLNWVPAQEGLAAANIRGLAVHPNPDLASASQGLRLYAGYGDQFYSSPALWRTNGLSSLQWQVQNTGLFAGQLRFVLIDPTTARAGSTLGASHVYAAGRSSFIDGYLNGGLYKSLNGGGSWNTIDAGLPLGGFDVQLAPQIGTVRAMALDLRSCAAEPRLPQPDCIALPEPAPGDPARGPLQRIYATATGTTGGFRVIGSADAGATWTNLDLPGSGIPPTRTIVQDVDGVEYIYFEQIVPLAIAVSPTDPDRLVTAGFAGVVCERSSDAEPCPPGLAATLSDPHTGVFRSDDRGQSWTPMNTGLPRRSGGYANAVPDAFAMAMHPSNHDILWVSMTDVDAPADALPPPIWKSVDGGQSWSASSSGIPDGTDMRSLVVDQGDGNRLYAAGAGTLANPGSVFRSDDGGASWRSVSIGLPADSAFALAIDPHNPSVLHAGTNTGVWSIEQLPDDDGDGIPDTVEDFAPGGGDGNGDGSQDSTQGAVGSTIVLFGLNAAKRGALAGAKGASGYVTSEISATSGSCAQAVDVQNRLAARYGRDYVPGGSDYYRYPRDLVQFEVLDCGAASIDLIFHNADFAASYGWSFRFYGPATPGDDVTVGWHDISARAAPIAPDRWRLQLQASAFGSYRPEADRILFLGGPACWDDRVFGTGFEAVDDRLPSCAAP